MQNATLFPTPDKDYVMVEFRPFVFDKHAVPAFSKLSVDSPLLPAYANKLGGNKVLGIHYPNGDVIRMKNEAKGKLAEAMKAHAEARKPIGKVDATLALRELEAKVDALTSKLAAKA